MKASQDFVAKRQQRHRVGADYKGAWGLEPPLGNAKMGLSPLKILRKHFLVVQITEAQDNDTLLTLLLYTYISILFG